MYKILNAAEQIHAINAAYSNYEVGATYCELKPNANGTKWAVPILPVLNKLGLDFITTDWLTTDIVENLPADWTWHLPEKPIRIILDNSKLPSEMLGKTPFYQLINAMLDTHIEQAFPQGNQTFIYVAYIEPTYQSILDDAAQRGTIKIETNT